jgi:LmbE family N-acetylglucosaminyl deacetylase
MCWAGILDCFGKKDKWFSAVVTADGAGSPRTGLYADYTNEEMMDVRRLEQKKAAFVGEYSALAMLNYTSSAIKDGANREVVEDYKEILMAMKPEVVFTHNLADKHDTHIGVVTKVIKAIRELDPADRPKKVYGGEVWRSLDWVNDEEKTVFDVTEHQNMAASLVSLFDSQVAGGKRYDHLVSVLQEKGMLMELTASHAQSVLKNPLEAAASMLHRICSIDQSLNLSRVTDLCHTIKIELGAAQTDILHLIRREINHIDGSPSPAEEPCAEAQSNCQQAEQFLPFRPPLHALLLSGRSPSHRFKAQNNQNHTVSTA